MRAFASISGPEPRRNSNRNDPLTAMKQHVFKRSRRVGGKATRAKTYSGRYRLDGDIRDITVSLGVTDKQVAESKLAAIVRQAERERQGLLAPLIQIETVSRPLKLEPIPKPLRYWQAIC